MTFNRRAISSKQSDLLRKSNFTQRIFLKKVVKLGGAPWSMARCIRRFIALICSNGFSLRFMKAAAMKAQREREKYA